MLDQNVYRALALVHNIRRAVHVAGELAAIAELSARALYSVAVARVGGRS